MTDRAVKLTCFNCDHEWVRELGEDMRIGQVREIPVTGKNHDSTEVCVNRKGFPSCDAVECPVCLMTGPHNITSRSEA